MQNALPQTTILRKMIVQMPSSALPQIPGLEFKKLNRLSVDLPWEVVGDVVDDNLEPTKFV